MSQSRLNSTEDRALVSVVSGLEKDVQDLKQKQFTSNKGGIVYYHTASDEVFDVAVTATPSAGSAVIAITAVFTSDTQKFPFIEFVPNVWHTAVSDANAIPTASSGGYIVSYLPLENQLGWRVVYARASATDVNFYVKANFYGTDKGTFTISAVAV